MSLFARAYGSAGAVLMAVPRRTPGHHIRHQGEPASAPPFGVEKPAAAVISQAHHSLGSVTGSAVPCNERVTMPQCQPACGTAVLWLGSGMARHPAPCLEQEEMLLIPLRFSVGQSVTFLASPSANARPQVCANGSIAARFRFQTASGTIVQREGEQTVLKVALDHAGADLKAKKILPHGAQFIDAWFD